MGFCISIASASKGHQLLQNMKPCLPYDSGHEFLARLATYRPSELNQGRAAPRTRPKNLLAGAQRDPSHRLDIHQQQIVMERLNVPAAPILG